MPIMSDTRRIQSGVPRDGLAIVTADQSTVVGNGTSGRPLRANGAEITGVVDVRYYGATGRGGDYADAILRAVDDAAEGLASSSDVFGAFVYFPKGWYRSSRPIELPNGVGLRGDNPAATLLMPTDDFNFPSFVRNAHQDGDQEFVFLEKMRFDGNKGGGSICSVALIDIVSVFVNSYIEHVVVLNSSSVGLRIAARNGLGPFPVRNTWVRHSDGHNILVEEEAGNTNAVNGISLEDVTSENSGPGSAAIFLKGRGHSAQWNLSNIHIEQGTPDGGRTGITIDGVSSVMIGGVQLLADSSTMDAGIRITDAITNVGIEIDFVTNENLIDPVLDDQKNDITIGADNIRKYLTADIAFRGGPRFRPGSADAAISMAIQDSSGTNRIWFDREGRLNGRSQFDSSLDIVANPFNDRPLLFLNKDKTLAYGWQFFGNDIRFRDFSGPVDLLNFETSGRAFFYHPLTLQDLLILQSSLIGPGTRLTPPSTGTHVAGEIVFVGDPVPGGFAAWICVEGGDSGGTWKPWGEIAP